MRARPLTHQHCKCLTFLGIPKTPKLHEASLLSQAVVYQICSIVRSKQKLECSFLLSDMQGRHLACTCSRRFHSWQLTSFCSRMCNPLCLLPCKLSVWHSQKFRVQGLLHVLLTQNTTLRIQHFECHILPHTNQHYNHTSPKS